MHIPKIVKRIRETCPAFEDRVYAVINIDRIFASHLSDSSSVPTAIIYPAPSTPENYEIENNNQMIVYNFIVAVVVDNKIKGESDKQVNPYNQVYSLLQDIYNALASFSPLANKHSFRCTYGGDFPIEETEARLYYGFTWSVKSTIKITEEVPIGDTSLDDTLLTDMFLANVPEGEDGSVPKQDYRQVIEDSEYVEPTP